MSAVVLAAASQAEGNFLMPNGTFFVVLIIFLIVLGVIGDLRGTADLEGAQRARQHDHQNGC